MIHGLLLFLPFLSLYLFLNKKELEREREEENKKRQEFIDKYYQKDMANVKRLVTRWKNE